MESQVSENNDENVNENQQTKAFAESLRYSGNYWILKVESKEWGDILSHYLYQYMPDDAEENDGANSGAYYLRIDSEEFYYLAKEYIPATVLSKITGIRLRDLFHNEIIVLPPLEIYGDPDATPNVGYTGNA